MRTVNSATLPGINRKISSEIVVRDIRLRFDNDPISEMALLCYDADEYGTGILRVGVDASNEIYFQYISDMESFPAWTASGITVMAGSKIGLFGDTLFYQKGDGTICTRQFGGTTFGSETATSYTISEAAALAPVSSTQFYATWNAANESTAVRFVKKIAFYGISSEEWWGRVYDKDADIRLFDAARVDDVDYVYFTEEDEKRTRFITHSGSWSEKQFVIPLDVADDISLFRMAGVSVINGKVIMTGTLKRSYGDPMLIYSIGPDKFTLGRDMFIGTSGTDAIGGKLHLVGSTVWYLGPSICYSAPATYLVGYDNASLKTTLANLTTFQVTEASSQAFAARIDIPAATSHAAVRTGSEVEVKVKINDQYVTIGFFNIDAILPQQNLSGKRKTLVLRSIACKRLMHWQSDAPYDYWSQTKLKTAPANMEDVIRITGKWSEDETSGDLYLEDIAEDGFLYLTPKETRNGLIKAKFKQVSNDAPIKFGVGLNYYVESKADAAARLGIDTYEVKDNMLQNNGIFAIYGMHDISGTDTLGIAVYQIDGTGFHLLSDAGSNPLFYEVDFGLDYYWLQMRFEEGRIKVWYRADASTSWTSAVDDVPVYYGDNFPWTYDELGRGCIYGKNDLGKATLAVDLSSADTVIVFNEDTSLSTGQVKIDGELLTVSVSPEANSSQAPTNVSFLSYSDNMWWQHGGPLNTDLESEVILGSLVSNAAYRWNGNYSNTLSWPRIHFLFEEINLKVKKVGNPIDNLIVSVNGAPATGYPLGKPVASITFPAGMISSDYSWVRGLSPKSPQYPSTNTSYYFVISRSGPIDPDNYYCLHTNAFNLAVNPDYGIRAYSIYNSSTKTWTNQTGTLYGITSTGNAERNGMFLYNSSYVYDNEPNKVYLYFFNLDYTSITGTAPYYGLGWRYLRIGNGVYRIVKTYFKSGRYGYANYETFVKVVLDRPVDPGDSGYPDGFNFDDVENQSSYPEEYGITSFTGAVWLPMQHTDYEILPYRKIISRNQNPAFHGAGSIVYDYPCDAPYFLCSEAQFYSSDQDMSIADIVTEVARKAQVLNVVTDNLMEVSVTPSVGSSVIQKKDLVAKVSGEIDGSIVFEGRKADAGTEGIKLTITSNSVTYSYGGVTRETLPVDAASVGRWVVSFFEGHIGVWRNGMHLASFAMTTSDAGITGEYFKISGTSTLALDVDIPTACARYDNFILDNSKTGMQMILEIIGNKKFYFHDNSSGDLKFYRTRDVVNLAAPYESATEFTRTENDAPQGTRIRVFGAEVKEVIDAEMMREHGNIFREFNINEIFYTSDAEDYADFVLEEVGSSYYVDDISGAADPRLEPNDIYYVKIGATTYKYYVDNIDYTMAIVENEAVFDMNINCRIPRSEL